MKNVLTTLALIFALGMSTSLIAQHKFGASASLGVAKLTGELGKDGSFGLSYNVEAKYYLKEKIAVGVEYNANAMGYANEASFIGISTYNTKQYLVKGEYFFTDTKVKPYIGLGLGLSAISTPELSVLDDNGGSSTIIPAETKNNFSISPKVGVMFGIFGIDFSYNIDGKTPDSEVFNTATTNQAFNYYNIRLKYVYDFEY